MGKEDGDEKPAADNNMMVKAVAGVFAMVVAPVLVALGMKFSDAIVANFAAKPEPAKSESSQKESPKPDSGTTAGKTDAATGDAATTAGGKTETAKADAARSDAKADGSNNGPSQPASGEKNVATVPGGDSKTTAAGGAAKSDETAGGKGLRKKGKAAANEAAGPVVRLFNLKDFSGWYKYVDKTSKSDSSPGRDKDPDGVFKVDNGMIHISGQYWGTLTTKDAFENYHLTVEFKWGTKQWGDKEQHARRSGVLMHGFGPDGAHLGWAPQSIKCQVIEGGTGDLLCINIKTNTDVSFAVEAAASESGAGKKRKTTLGYKPGEPLTTITHGFVKRLGNGSDWRDVAGFHRTGDIEKPTGEWNTLECICQGARLRILLNGKVVNQASKVHPTKGRISLQSLGSEIFFRKVELQKLAKN